MNRPRGGGGGQGQGRGERVVGGLGRVHQVTRPIRVMARGEMVQRVLEVVVEAMGKLVTIQVIVLEVVVVDLF